MPNKLNLYYSICHLERNWSASWRRNEVDRVSL